MERLSSLRWIAALFVMVITLLVGATEARAVNRFRVVGRDLPLSSVGNIVEIQADLDQDVYGFSLSFNFDETLLEIESINLGEDVARLEPEYNAGIIDNDAGTASWGVVFALSAESIDVKLDAGASRRVVELVVNVLATDEESTVIDLIDVGGNPGRRNVMTDVDGNSVSPDPTLSDGTINLTEVGPVIEGVFPTSGTAGTQLLVSGRNFDQAGLVVRLCDQEVADPELLGGVGSTIRFPAPPCGTAGVSVLEICTDFGCAQSVFVYEQIDPGTPFIRGNANNDATVDLSDAVQIFGVLFLGLATRAPCDDALDVNDSGDIDITDGIYLLGGLFQGGPPPPAPFPNPGLDPTEDSLPECTE